MPSPKSDNGDTSRLDRIERTIEHLLSLAASHDGRIDRLATRQEDFQRQHEDLHNDLQLLLRSQVILTDSHGKLTEAQRETEKKLAELAEAQRHTEERLNSLIEIVDGMIRKRPPEPPSA